MTDGSNDRSTWPAQELRPDAGARRHDVYRRAGAGDRVRRAERRRQDHHDAVILGLDAPDAGTALVGGHRYATLNRPLTHLGSLLDAAALQPSRTGRNHLLWLAHSQGLDAARVDAVLGQAGLDKAARRRAGGYSLGMRQRLGIAAAMLGDPPVLMM